MDISLRPVRDRDAAGVIKLIGDCFAEYPGCVMDVDGELPELKALASHYRKKDGRFWVADCEGEVVGCIGVAPAASDGGVELQKLYVASRCRRQGLATRLCALVEAEAARRQARFIDLWSDTRFTNAHRLYERQGYRRGPDTRDLHDLSNSVEYYYRKDL